MAVVIEQIRLCDRCDEAGIETEADVVDRYTLNGFKFEQDLCRDHSAELYNLIMHIWGDSATKTGEPSVFDKPIRLSTTPTRVKVEQPETAPEPALALVQQRPELPHSAQRWTLTNHATQQMTERGFSLYDVLMACERSQTVSPNQEHRDASTQLRRYGRCLVSVNPTEFRVLTVMVAGESKHSWNRKQSKAKTDAESAQMRVEA